MPFASEYWLPECLSCSRILNPIYCMACILLHCASTSLSFSRRWTLLFVSCWRPHLRPVSTLKRAVGLKKGAGPGDIASEKRSKKQRQIFRTETERVANDHSEIENGDRQQEPILLDFSSSALVPKPCIIRLHVFWREGNVVLGAEWTAIIESSKSMS
jgi:hypothetical protein